MLRARAVRAVPLLPLGRSGTKRPLPDQCHCALAVVGRCRGLQGGLSQKDGGAARYSHSGGNQRLHWRQSSMLVVTVGVVGLAAGLSMGTVHADVNTGDNSSQHQNSAEESASVFSEDYKGNYFKKGPHGEVDRLAKWKWSWQDGKLNWHRKEPNVLLRRYYDLWAGEGDSKAVVGLGLGLAKEGKEGGQQCEQDKAAAGVDGGVKKGQTTAAAGAKGSAKGGGRGKAPQHRVLVPLCGKTVDLPWLADQGNDVVGIEGIESAVYQLQAESWLHFESTTLPCPPKPDMEEYIEPSKEGTFEGPLAGYVFTTRQGKTGYYVDPNRTVTCFMEKRKPLVVIVGDFFEIGSPMLVGDYDRVWDRASMVAVPPFSRAEYVRTIDRLLVKGGKILLVTLEYDQDKVMGPPFSIDLHEVERLYGNCNKKGRRSELGLNYDVQLLSREKQSKEYSGGKWSVLEGEVYESTFLLTKKEDSKGDSTTAAGGWKKKRWVKWLTLGLGPYIWGSS